VIDDFISSVLNFIGSKSKSIRNKSPTRHVCGCFSADMLTDYNVNGCYMVTLNVEKTTLPAYQF